MKTTFLLFVVCLIGAVGCKTQTGVAPTETVIARSSDRDFGFEGTWVSESFSESVGDDSGTVLTITRDGDYVVKISDLDEDLAEGLEIVFRTHEIQRGQPHAVVEVELHQKEEVAYHRLAIAAVKDDMLYLWMIDGRKIGALLYENNVPAVIEHFTFSSTVRCDPEKLLAAVVKNSNAVVGDVLAFRRRVAEDK